MKNADLEVTSLAKSFARLGDQENQSQAPTEHLIYDHLSELMEIVGHIADSYARRTHDVDNSAYATMSFLEGQMTRWYTNLPGPLKWKPANIKTAPKSFFLMQ